MSAIQSSDKFIPGPPMVCVAYASYYGKRKTSVMQLVRLVQDAMPVLRKLLNFPGDVTVRIGGIKGRVQGRYFSSERVAVIDASLPIRKALETLCHELVHAEQYHTGRLSRMYVAGKGFVDAWHDEAVFNKGTTYKAYREQPWEVEAFSRAPELAAAVQKELTGWAWPR